MPDIQFEQTQSFELSAADTKKKSNSIRGRRIIKTLRDDKPSNNLTIPEIGTKWPLTGVDIYFNDYSLNKGEIYDTYTYNYSKIKDRYGRSTIKGALENVPLKEKKGYLTAWEYVLTTDNTNSQSILPAWYATATDLAAPDDDYVWKLAPIGYFKLVEGGDELLKNGIRTFKQYSTVVSETIYFVDKTIIDNASKIVGDLRAPADVHGLEEDDKYWLVTSANTSEEGPFYKIVLTYKYKKYIDKDDKVQGWDEDIYELWDA